MRIEATRHVRLGYDHIHENKQELSRVISGEDKPMGTLKVSGRGEIPRNTHSDRRWLMTRKIRPNRSPAGR